MNSEKKVKFPTLKAEMARKHVTSMDLAKLLHRTNGSISSRMNGRTEWLYWEVVKVWEYLDTGLSLTELFKEADEK